MELTYWSDAVDQVLLDRLAREAHVGATAAIAPTLYPGQGILTTNRALARRNVVLRDEDEAARSEWLVVSRRTAYWPLPVTGRLREGCGRLVAVRSRQGVWLAGLWHFPSSSPQKAGGDEGRQ